tara:strand:+ start:542 stop:3307 length:2766 start_codon:yes stop_codon:yes gene_type:complete
MFEDFDNVQFRHEVGARVQTSTGAEGIVTESGSPTSIVMMTSLQEYNRMRVFTNQYLKPIDPWRDALEKGNVVEYRILNGWYHCHVYSVSETELVLTPVLSHTLFSVSKNSVRIKQSCLQCRPWNVRNYPTHVRCSDTLYACYGTTRAHYIVDTRAGRAYFPKQDCTAVERSHPTPIHIGTLHEPCDIPKECIEQLHYETILELLQQSESNECAIGLRALDCDRYTYQTYRHWSAGAIAQQLEMSMQLNDAEFIQELLDIAGLYNIANRSQRLEQALRARSLVNIHTAAEGDGVRLDVYWNGFTPRPHTMLAARDVFRRLQSRMRPEVSLSDPYGPPRKHLFLHPYQTRTLENMCHLEDCNLSELFTYKVNGAKCNDYMGVSRPLHTHGGGYLSADVGLGKTVIMCALMLERPMPTLVVVPPTLINHWEQLCKRYGIFTSVCHGTRGLPTTTVRQVKEYSKKIKSGYRSRSLIRKLTELYVMDRTLTTDTILQRVRKKHLKCHHRALAASQSHCILTTPGTLRNQWSKFIFVHRIVLDEAHIYKSSKTVTVRAIHTICPNTIWCITATPQTHIQQAQLLNVYPGAHIQNLSDQDMQQIERITLRLSRDTLEANGQLQTIPMTEETVICEPTSVYAARYEHYRATLEQAYDDHTFDNREFKRILEDLERMCIHTSCVPIHRYGTRIDVDTATFDNITKMFNFDAKHQKRVKETIAALDTCALCLEQYERPTITSCGHVYCRECVTQLQKHTNKCPQCREPVHQFVELVDTSDDIHRITHMGQVYQVPTIAPEEGNKVKQIETILKQGSTVVCSKYTSVIRYLAKRFDMPAITGKTTQVGRVKALEAFEKNGVLLITEKSAGVGLCLQRAHNLVFVEPNMKNKEQVVGRIKRLGQTHPIKLWTLVCKDTIDEREGSSYANLFC